MIKSTKLLMFAVIALAATGCKKKETGPTPTKQGITLSDAPQSPDFPGASLSITAATAAARGTDSSKVSFAFALTNFTLTQQTNDAHTRHSNSVKGQHIHFIMDNAPYTALYEPKHDIVLPNNTEHTLVAFLSRSYHESLKKEGAAVVYHFKIDGAGNIQVLPPHKNEMVFYSRPKGDYIGSDTVNVMLDFYLSGTSLGTNNAVRAEVKNETTGAQATFTVKDWKPKFLNGMGTGKCSVKLTLLDKNGVPVSGPNTTITHNINLAAK